jgi:hypothetical protein
VQVGRAVDWLVGPGAVLLLVTLVVTSVRVRRSPHGWSQQLRRDLPVLVLTLSVVVFLLAALAPSPLRDPPRPVELVPFSRSSGTDAEILLNYLAFAWLAALNRLFGTRTAVTVTVLVLPVAVEVAQFAVGWGRVASATDVVVGLLGVVSGLVAASLLLHLHHRPRRAG